MSTFLCASHGHCFDGLASAALLTDLVDHVQPRTKFTYRALGYGPAPPRVEFSGDQNALLDYKYIPDAALTFYLDHHPTAFSNPQEREHFEAKKSVDPERFVHDASSPSCANLVAKFGKAAYGRDTFRNRQIEAFAQKIDSAAFATVDEAIETNSPNMRLVSAVTHFGDHQFYQKAIPILLREGIDGLAEQRFIKEQFNKLTPALKSLNERIKKQGTVSGRVATINLLDRPTHVVSKFRQYFEFPKATYSVMLMRMQENLRISVGYNPWSGSPCDVNIGRLCQTFGGGGHAVVGAIGLADGSEESALKIAKTIALKLQTPERPEPNADATLASAQLRSAPPRA